MEQLDRWRSPFEYRVLYGHSDTRGILTELIRFEDWGVPPGGQLYSFTINPGETRGNHYHLKKHEWFICINGTATITFKTTAGTIENLELEGDSLGLMYIAPGNPHALTNNTNEIITCLSYASTAHDPENTDTYFEKLI